MKINYSLHELIHALSGSEKAYFKKFVGANKTQKITNYIELFDLIVKQKEYDENKLIHYLETNNKSYAKRLSVEKKYLYELILESLEKFKEKNTSYHEKCIKMINQADLLMTKGLLRQAKNRLNLAKRIAVENDLYIVLRYLQEKEIKFILYEYDSLEKSTHKKLLRLSDEISEVHDQLVNVNEYRKISSSIELTVIQHENKPYAKLIRHLDKIAQHPLMLSDKMANGYIAKLYYYHILHIYNFLTRNFQNAYKYAQLELNGMHEKPKRHAPYSKAHGYYNVYISLIELNDIHEARKLMNEVKELVQVHEHIGNFILGQFYPLLFNFYWRNEDLKGVEGVLTEYQKYKQQLKFKGDVYVEYLMIICYTKLDLIKGEPKQALRRLNQLLSIKIDELKIEIFLSIRLLELVVHTELQNFDLVVSRKNSLVRWIKENPEYKANSLQYFLKALDIYFKYYPEKPNSFTLLKLEKQFGAYEMSRRDFLILRTFDFKRWIYSKFTN